MKITKSQYIQVNKFMSGKRIDNVIKSNINHISRNQIIKLIKKKYVYINKKQIIKPSKKTKYKDLIKINKFTKTKNKPIANNNIKINKIYEDKNLLIINKKKNTVVHPGAGNLQNTLMNTLMFYYPNIYKQIPRCGIVHRLDKDTTGLMIIAKDIKTYKILIKKIKNRKIKRIYYALVHGNIKSDGIINIPISRNKYHRTIMSVNKKGKKSITYYKVIQKFSLFTWIKIKLHSGRTHQIRVHMNYINHPIVGEKIYINKNIYQNINNIPKNILYEIKKLNRQALHASQLKFIHPIKKTIISIKSSLPLDIKKIIKCISNYK